MSAFLWPYTKPERCVGVRLRWIWTLVPNFRMPDGPQPPCAFAVVDDFGNLHRVDVKRCAFSLT